MTPWPWPTGCIRPEGTILYEIKANPYRRDTGWLCPYYFYKVSLSLLSLK